MVTGSDFIMCDFFLQGYPSGFPVLLPNRLSQQRSTAVMQYLLDGNYLDKSTRQLTAEMLTYNADLQVLGYTRATFDWQRDGAIKGKHSPNMFSRRQWEALDSGLTKQAVWPSSLLPGWA